jgi:hypothetical protein
MYKINLQEIFQGAEDQKCGIVLNTKEVVLCDEYPTSVISTCRNKATHHSLKWACEKMKTHSLPQVHQYKNEFCELCNEMGYFPPNETYVEGTSYTECFNSKTMHIQYENACRYLPTMAFHRNISPHRKNFCSFCAHEDQSKEHVTSHICEPKFGDNMRFAIRLIRNLFSPGLIFNSEIRITSVQVGYIINTTLFPVKSSWSSFDVPHFVNIRCSNMFYRLYDVLSSSSCMLFLHFITK